MMMHEDARQGNTAQLGRLVEEFRRQLAERGIAPAAPPTVTAPLLLDALRQVVISYIDAFRDENSAWQQRNRQLRCFIDNAPVAIAMFDREMTYLAVSRRWISDYGLQGRDVIGQSHYAIFPDIPESWKSVHRRALTGEVIRAAEDRYERADGTVQWLRWEAQPWFDDDGTVGGIVLFTEDITDLKLAEEALQRRNNTLHLLSTANETLVRVQDEVALLQQACAIAVEVGGYRLAWIGYLQHDAENTVLPVAHAGVDDGFFEAYAFSWDDTRPEGQGPLGHAARTRHPVSVDDFRATPFAAPWREGALARGMRSGIFLPLLVGDEVLGVLSLLRKEAYRFLSEECTLLMELANDLAFSITTLRASSARLQAEEALLQSEWQYRTIVETAQEGIWVLDNTLRATYANQRLAEMLGYETGEIIGRSVYDFIAPERRAEMDEHMERRRGGLREVYEFQFQRRDGTLVWTQISGSPLIDARSRFVGTFGMLTDVTERHEAEEYRREFARKTIEAATEGKLLVSEREEIEQLAGPALARWPLHRADDLETIRHAVAEFVREAGMEASRIDDFVLCISEAATNAIKHVGRGSCSLHRPDEAFFAVIADRGPGILVANLPELAFKRGYSTGVSLGMGYKAIISLADKVYLATGPGGTTVGIRMGLTAPPVPPPVFPAVGSDWTTE